MKVQSRSQTENFYKHFADKCGKKYEFGVSEKICQPFGLVVMLDGDGERVQEHQYDNGPVEALRFNDAPYEKP